MTPQMSEQEQQAREDVELRAMGFARAIVATPEYRAFMQANGELAQDREARSLLQQYQLKTNEVRHRGYDAASLDELKALQVRVRENAILTAFYTTQAALVALLKETNDRISAKIGQQFAQARQGGCC
jgi:cell fate (sporulation/competence/biofilm development) regulator YlbF (YheA/YmcA/DUF963 family)